MVNSVLEEIKEDLTEEHLILSVAAGKTLPNMLSIIGHDKRMARLMVNTPSLVGEMAGAFSIGGKATKLDS